MCMNFKNTENDPELVELQNQVLEKVLVEYEGVRVQMFHRVKKEKLTGEFLEVTEYKTKQKKKRRGSRLKYFKQEKFLNKIKYSCMTRSLI